jgi:hypothetical protein
VAWLLDSILYVDLLYACFEIELGCLTKYVGDLYCIQQTVRELCLSFTVAVALLSCSGVELVSILFVYSTSWWLSCSKIVLVTSSVHQNALLVLLHKTAPFKYDQLGNNRNHQLSRNSLIKLLDHRLAFKSRLHQHWVRVNQAVKLQKTSSDWCFHGNQGS